MTFTTAREALDALTRHVPGFPAEGVVFEDLTPVFADADAFRLVIDELAQFCKQLDGEVVAGLDARGFLVGSAVAYSLGQGCLAVRKKGKLPPPVITEEYTLEYGTAALEIPAEGIDIKGKIPEGERADTGRVIARLTDLGAGQTLRHFLTPASPDEQIPKTIGDLAVSVLADWDWAVRPDCVVGIPSAHRPNSAQSLAQGLAAVGRMEYSGQLELLRDPGSPDVNSAYRVKNLWDALRVGPQLEAAVAGRTVLLTDLEIASRWTMTIAARLLKQAGAAAVLPFALAQRG